MPFYKFNNNCKIHFYQEGRFGLMKIAKTLSLFIGVPVPSQDSKPSCTCIDGIDFATFYDFSFGLWKCPDCFAFFFFFYYKKSFHKLLCSFFLYHISTRFIYSIVFCCDFFTFAYWLCLLILFFKFKVIQQKCSSWTTSSM